MSNPKIVLTAREQEVLNLLSQGYSSKEISQKLFISPNTVEYHRKQLLRKSGAKNVAQLIGLAFRMRWLKLDLPD
ncbi:MAG: helix-turn-helix transcriptional regulator [Muribaculaceae bacterium]|nr:helix-turn-helix transcriptional regulator [Muribaculaceae bacterium]